MIEGPAGLASPRWSCSTEDALGRTICETRPGFRGSLLITSNEYNTANQLIATRSYSLDENSTPTPLTYTYICYNSLGQRTLTVSDMNLNGQIDWNDTDRIVSNDTRYVSLNGSWWRESSSWQTRQNGSSALTRVGLTRTRLTGLASSRGGDIPVAAGVLTSETHSLDPLNNETVSCSYLDRSSHTTTQTTLSPDSSLPAETVVQSGLTVSSRSPTGVTTTYAYDAKGNRTSRTVRSPAGETTEARRSYDKYGRLIEIASFGTSVKYRYDAKGRIARQTVDGSPIDFAYTKYGQLAGKYLGGKEKPDASVEYEYLKSGQIVARTANGVRQTYEYDGRGQLLAVKEDGADVECYVYDKAGNMLKKTIRGKTTTFAFDGANQLVSSTTDGVTTKYAYDAAGRLVREGNKTYCYGYLDKVLSVTEGERKYTYDYHVDGQLARADYGNGKTEDFGWDGLALIKRGDERFVNEPHIGGGNPVASSKGTSYFNDALGTTVGSKSNDKYSAAALTAFGEDLTVHTPTPTHNSNFFTGKPQVAGLGHAFLFRNYRAGLAKWQTADPLGYPDGWNALAYCGNGVTGAVDLWGCVNINLFKEGTHCWRIANLYNESGYFTVGGHGQLLHDENDSPLTVEQLAAKIRDAGWNGTSSIKLLSCNTGKSQDYCQDLANLLGVSVFAADTLVWYITTEREWYAFLVDVFYDDVMLITGGTVALYERDAEDAKSPDYDRPGRFIEFKPE